MVRQAISWTIVLLGILVLCIQAVFAYGDREPPVVVEAHITHSLTEPTTFAILPMRYQANDRYFSSIASVVRTELIKRGYRETNPTQASLIVVATYQMTDVTDYLYVPPVYSRTLRLTMLDRAAYAQRQILKRFEAITMSSGENSNLAMVYPLHAKAIFYDFPGPKVVNQTIIARDLSDNGLELGHTPIHNPSFYYLNTDYPFE